MNRIFLLLIFLTLNIVFAFAQREADIESLAKLSLEELLNMEVISASKSEEKLTEAPGIIQVITSEEIDRFGALNLGEVLDRMTGVMVVGSQGYPQNVASIRGDLTSEFDTHTLLLLNGRPMRESLYGGVNASIYQALPVSAIQRVEVIRGPGSVLYGSNAYAGVINVITNDISETAAEIRLRTGSFGTTQAEGNFTVAENELKINGAMQYYDEKGWEFTATDFTNDTRTIDMLEENRSFLLNSEYKGLTFNGLYTQTNQRIFSSSLPIWSVPGLTDEDIENKMASSNRLMADLGYQWDISNRFKTNINATYNHFGLGLDYGDSVVFSRKADRANDLLFEVTNFYSPSEKLNVLFGGTAYFQAGELTNSVEKYNREWYSAYTQLDYRIVKPVKLILGAQFNSIGTSEDLVPRVGAVWNISNKLGSKILWSKSFRAPYAFETDVNIPGVQVGNPNLEAEKLSNLDLQMFYTSDRFEAYATYFNYKSDGLIYLYPLDFTNPVGGTTYINVGPGQLTPSGFFIEDDLKGWGLELETKFVPNENIFITSSYAYQTSKVEVTGFTIEDSNRIPNHMFKAGVSYQTTNKALTLGLFNSYITEFNPIVPTDLQNDTPVFNGTSSDINLLSANLNIDMTELLKFNLKQRFILGFYATNLLNEEVKYPDISSGRLDSIPGRPGAAYYGSLTVKF